MKKNKLFGCIMTGALALGVIGGASVPTFAAANNTSNSASSVEQAVNVKASLDEETKQKVQAIMDELKTQLADFGVELPTKGNRGNMFADLDDETKEKAQAIMEQLKTDSITQEEAQTQLADLGVELPTKGNRGNMFADLDDETKEKAQAIMEQLKTDSITQEEAQTQLADLGVELPEKALKGEHDDMFANLDDETKEKVQALMDEAKAQLADLGVDHLPFKGLEDSTNEQ